MTEQHLIGELSVLLSQLQASASTEASQHQVARLRREVETAPVSALAGETVAALRLVDDLCWDALSRGDSATFVRQSGICAQLLEFGASAGLVEEE